MFVTRKNISPQNPLENILLSRLLRRMCSLRHLSCGNLATRVMRRKAPPCWRYLRPPGYGPLKLPRLMNHLGESGSPAKNQSVFVVQLKSVSIKTRCYCQNKTSARRYTMGGGRRFGWAVWFNLRFHCNRHQLPSQLCRTTCFKVGHISERCQIRPECRVSHLCESRCLWGAAVG